MLNKMNLTAPAFALTLLAPGALLASLRVRYSCKQTFNVAQTGGSLELKNDKGDVGRAVLTSNVSLSAGGPWNVLGVIRADNSIQWSNGAKWQKQQRARTP